MSPKCIRYIVFLFIAPIISRAQTPEMVLPVGHTGTVNSINFSPDDKKIITASEDGTVKIWDAATGMILASINAKQPGKFAQFSLAGDMFMFCTEDRVEWRKLDNVQESIGFSPGNEARFSRDGKQVLAWRYNLVVLWSALNRSKPVFDLTDVNSFLEAGFTPDGKFIYTINSDFKENAYLRIWNRQTGTLVKKINSKNIKSVSFLASGKEVVINHYSGPLKIFNVLTGQLVLDMASLDSESEQGYPTSDEQYLIVCKRDSVKFFHLEHRRFVNQLRQKGSVDRVIMHPGKMAIISDSAVLIWDLSQSKVINSWNQVETVDIAFSHNGNYLGSAAGGKHVFDPNLSNINYPVEVRDIRSGTVITEMKGHSVKLGSVFFMDKDTRIIVPGGDSSVWIWDLYNTKPGAIHSKLFQSASGMSFHRKTGRVGLLFNDRVLVLDSLGKVIFKKEDNSIWMPYIQISPDGSRIVFTNSTHSEVWHIDSGTKQFDLRGVAAPIQFAAFSPDNSRVVTACDNGTFITWDAITGNRLHVFGDEPGIIYSADYSEDSKKIVTGGSNEQIIIWDAQSGQPLKTIPLFHEPNFVKFLPGDKEIIALCDEGWVAYFDTETGHPLAELEGHRADVKSSDLSSDGRLLVTIGTDNTGIVWNNNTRQQAYTFYLLRSNDFFAQIPSGYYHASRNAARLLHYATKDLKVITFEQLDIKYNRPDKVLEAAGNTEVNLIRSYRKAWEKRIRKIGIDTTQFNEGYSVPVADIINRDSIEYAQTSENLQLHIKGADEKFNLERFNIWVNEVPLYGQRGINIRRRKAKGLDTVLSIVLTPGINRIETSVTNSNGIESYRILLTVNYTPVSPQKQTVHFIGIGIDQFSDTTHNLKYSVKDIRDLAAILKIKNKEIRIDTLFNGNVTIERVNALKDKLKETGVNDKVIVAYSGHGLLSKDYDYYLSTYAINFDKPEINGLPYDELENLLDSIPARKKLMLIDACHSGEVDKDDLVTLEASSDSLIKGLKPVAYKKEGQLGLKNSFELMQSLFVNVGKSTGATIISAAAGTQFALERGDLKNGVFTYSILEAMEKNKTLRISELKKIVGERVEQLTNGLQKPTSRNETIAVDWDLW